MSFVQLQSWKMLEPTCFYKFTKTLSNFDSNPLIFDSTLFPGKNSPNIAKSNRVFSAKGRGDRALIFTYLDNPMAEVFLHYTAYISRFRPPSGGNAWSKLDQKCKLRVRLFFINSSISFKQCFSFLLGHIQANRNLPRLCIFMRV